MRRLKRVRNANGVVIVFGLLVVLVLIIFTDIINSKYFTDAKDTDSLSTYTNSVIVEIPLWGIDKISLNNVICSNSSLDLTTKIDVANSNYSDWGTNNSSITDYNLCYLHVDTILQTPELPTGCEVTSLAILLNYLGYGVDKCTLADNYLAKYPIGSVSAWNGFIGDPRDSHSYGCYSPVIVNCANSYLGGARTVQNLTGCDVSELYNQIDAGHPVIVWATMGMKAPLEDISWVIDNSTFTWSSNERCYVLVGYDKDSSTITLIDTIEGTKVFDKDEFEQSFSKMGYQAVVIY